MILLALSGTGTPERAGRGKNRLEWEHNIADSSYLVKSDSVATRVEICIGKHCRITPRVRSDFSGRKVKA